MADATNVFRQPADETPLFPEPGRPGDPAIPAVPPAGPVGVPMPEDPVVRQSINDVAGQLVRGLDLVDESVQSQLAKARAELVKGTRLVDRVVKAEIAQADEDLSSAGRLLTDAGVPISYSPAERAAELDDPQGTALIERIAQVVQSQSPPTSPPPPPVAQENQCYWAWTGTEWRTGGLGGNDAADPASRPARPGTYPGELVFGPCAVVPPPPPPPTSPPPPPAVPPPVAAGDCDENDAVRGYPDGYHTDQHGPVQRDPDTGAPRGAVWTWDGVDRDDWVPEVYFGCGPGSPPVPAPDRRGAYVGEEIYVRCPVVYPCVTPPASPPTSPPPPAAPPAGNCPPPTIVVNCAPACPPTTTVPPPATKPSPPTTPPTSPPTTPPTSPPPPPATGPLTPHPGPGTFASLNWNELTACGVVSNIIAGGVPAEDKAQADQTPPAWASWVNAETTAIAWWLPSVTSAAAKYLDELGSKPGRVNELGTDTLVGSTLTRAASDYLPAAANPNPKQGLVLAARLGLAAKAEELTRAPLTYMFQSMTYLYQSLNPQYLPTQADIDGLYLRDRIDDSLWQCWTTALGNLPTPHRLVREAKQTIPGVSEVVALRRRELLPDDAAMVQRMRQLGVTDPAHATEFYKLSEFVPPFSDIIRMMVKDVEDEEVVKKYDYDKDFNRKFAGRLKKWAADQGIPEDVAIKLWRAHWDTPSNTALYDMLHRLRSDRPEVYEWSAKFAEETDKEAWKAKNPQPLIVTWADAKYLLEVNDMSPGWVEPLLDISYRPITNTDARRAYEIGSLTEDGLYHAFRDNGYSDENAKKLVKFAKADRDRTIGVKTGVTSPRKVLEAFRGGLIDRLEADRMLIPSFPDADVRRSILDRGEVERKIDTRRLAVKVLTKRYAYGEMDDVRLVNALGGLGIVGDESRTIVQRAQANRAGHLKEIRVQYVLDMLVRGILTVDQTSDRLEQLGYFPPDIDRMVALAGAIKTEKQAARAAAAANKARIDASRAKREALANLDRIERERKDQISQLERQMDRLKAEVQSAGGVVPSSSPA